MLAAFTIRRSGLLCSVVFYQTTRASTHEIDVIKQNVVILGTKNLRVGHETMKHFLSE